MPKAGGKRPSSRGSRSASRTRQGGESGGVETMSLAGESAANSGSESELDEKRMKVSDSSTFAVPASVAAAPGGGRPSRPRMRDRGGAGVGAEYVTRLKLITGEMNEVILCDGANLGVARAVIGCAGRYEALLMELVAENERLKGKIEAFELCGMGRGTSGPMKYSSVVSGARAAVAPVPAAPVPVAQATWAVTVRVEDPSTSKEVVEKVMKEVAPSFGSIRIHGVHPVSGGGAVIRTPSVAERQKIAENPKFSEAGLVVSVKDKLGPRISVQRVHSEITLDEFMEELYVLNFVELMPREKFGKCVRVISPPWRADVGQTNVVLECTPEVASRLESTGVYIKWFRFTVRAHEPVQTCYRCCGFDHRASECRVKDAVCRRCGLSGHIAQQCTNPMRCRNCELKGWPADHSMVSLQCPVYAGRLARVNARH